MIKEKSCGAVIYKFKNNELFFLIVQHNSGHYSFPKGHVEKDETEEETAIREVKEETNIDIKIIKGFREKITYSPKENTIKDVIFFLANPLNKEIKIQEEEIKNASWYNKQDALNIISYEEDQGILKKALNFIKKERNI